MLYIKVPHDIDGLAFRMCIQNVCLKRVEAVEFRFIREGWGLAMWNLGSPLGSAGGSGKQVLSLWTWPEIQHWSGSLLIDMGVVRASCSKVATKVASPFLQELHRNKCNALDPKPKLPKP